MVYSNPALAYAGAAKPLPTDCRERCIGCRYSSTHAGWPTVIKRGSLGSICGIDRCRRDPYSNVGGQAAAGPEQSAIIAITPSRTHSCGSSAPTPNTAPVRGRMYRGGGDGTYGGTCRAGYTDDRASRRGAGHRGGKFGLVSLA